MQVLIPSYLDTGGGDVVDEVVEDGLAIALAHSEIEQKLSHQLDVGDVREKDGQVASGKGHSLL